MYLLKHHHQMLELHLGDILDESPELAEYKKSAARKKRLSVQALIDLQISLNHIRSHTLEGSKLIDDILDDPQNEKKEGGLTDGTTSKEAARRSRKTSRSTH